MFEKIKENWERRISTNALTTTLTHANKKGIQLMRKEGYKFENLPEDCKVSEKVILKRSIFFLGDWTRIYPPVENGKVNYVNLIFGGKRNLIKLIGVLLLVAFVFMQFKDNFTQIDYLQGIVDTCNIKIPF